MTTTTISPSDHEPLDNMEIYVRVGKLLMANGYKTVGDLHRATDAELLAIPGFGRKSLQHVRRVAGRA